MKKVTQLVLSRIFTGLFNLCVTMQLIVRVTLLYTWVKTVSFLGIHLIFAWNF